MKAVTVQTDDNGKTTIAIRKDAGLLEERSINGIPCHVLTFEDAGAAWKLGNELIEETDSLLVSPF
jgi:hypothetical protein